MMRMIKVLTIIVTALVLFQSCAQTSEKILKDKSEFMEMSSEPLYQKYGQVSSLKLVYDTQYNKLHFISSKDYEYHYEYCINELGFPGDLNDFNRTEYSGSDSRRFLIANINYYHALDKYALELGPSDRMSAKQLQLLLTSVQSQIYIDKALYLMLNTIHVQSIANELDGFNTLSPAEVYGGQIYQPISKKTITGIVRVVNDWNKEKDLIGPNDIIILNDIPLSFPIVAGVIVKDFQTPLSHVTLLGQNRKIPICAYTKAFEDDELLAKNGDTVLFEVLQDTFYIEKTTKKLTLLQFKAEPIKLRKNLDVDTLMGIEFVKARHVDIVGNKAANFSELYRWGKKDGYKTPEAAFAIPFYFYDQHIKTSWANTLIQDLLQKDNLHRSREEVEKDLKLIRQAIKREVPNVRLVNDIRKKLQQSGYTTFRFRSSTNAEDMKGFSGAGLYTSKTVDLNSEKKTIEKALLKVWASVWSYDAFMERLIYNIDQSTVAMGILVHRSFPNEAVNGVAITTNLYRDNYLGFVVNAQLGDVSVVAPDNGVICDQFICYPDESVSEFGKENVGIDVITTSSLNNGELVMSPEEIQRLANTLELIKQRYLRKHYVSGSFFNFGLDIEFKLDEETRELYIKQMRVYNR